MKTIHLTEYVDAFLPRDDIPSDVGEVLWRNYRTQVDVEFPSPRTSGQWKLKSKGWVGHILLTPNLSIVLHPKVPLFNLFGMLEYAYNLKGFYFLQGLIDCEALEEFYSQLALVLAKRILDRCRKGIYRTYVPKTNQLAYIRGRLNVRQAIQKPWNIKFICDYSPFA